MHTQPTGASREAEASKRQLAEALAAKLREQRDHTTADLAVMVTLEAYLAGDDPNSEAWLARVTVAEPQVSTYQEILVPVVAATSLFVDGSPTEEWYASMRRRVVARLRGALVGA